LATAEERQFAKYPISFDGLTTYMKDSAGTYKSFWPLSLFRQASRILIEDTGDFPRGWSWSFPLTFPGPVMVNLRMVIQYEFVMYFQPRAQQSIILILRGYILMMSGACPDILSIQMTLRA